MWKCLNIKIHRSLYNPMLIGTKNYVRLVRTLYLDDCGRMIVVILYRKNYIGKTMSDYKGILNYRGVRLERFHCIQLLYKEANSKPV